MPHPENQEREAAKRESSTDRSQHAEQAVTSIAQESIERDMEYDEESAVLGRTVSQDPAPSLQHSMVGSYRRSSFFSSGLRPFLGAQPPEVIVPLEQDRESALREERSLLRDNSIIPPEHARRSCSQVSASPVRRLNQRLSIPGFPTKHTDPVVEESSTPGRDSPVNESTALLRDRDTEAAYGGEVSDEAVDRKWEEAILSGRIKTSWRREAKVLGRYSLPLIFTFLLQTSLTLTSVFVVGHIGKSELGAVSLGTMTVNITGYAVYHGLATSLDTLCAQAYGSGRKDLVGLNMQRMVWFLWLCTVPMACLWLAGTRILAIIVPEQDIAQLAGRYLKVMIIGAPGYAAFESGKRYVQAQGKFSATLYVLLLASPLNIVLQWLFVFRFNFGFIGCAMATVIIQNLMPTLLFLYVRFVGGLECWPGFTRKAFRNWGPMVRLALPGLAMVMAEFMAFEILTLASARISATHLAAQTILQSLSVMAYQLPFPLSIASSTRIANLIGATLPDAAKITAKVAFVAGTVLGLLNMIMLSLLRNYIPLLYTDDPDVRRLAALTLPVNAAFQLVDSLAAQGNGVLRGLGKQEIGGYINLFAYYGIAVPFSFFAAFYLHWDLYGLWAGPAIALTVVASLEATFIYRTSWDKAAHEASKRNAAG